MIKCERLSINSRLLNYYLDILNILNILDILKLNLIANFDNLDAIVIKTNCFNKQDF